MQHETTPTPSPLHRVGHLRERISNIQAETKSADFFTFPAVIQTENLWNYDSLPVLVLERPKMFHNSLTPNMVIWMLRLCRKIWIHPHKDRLKTPWPCLFLLFWMTSVSVSILQGWAWAFLTNCFFNIFVKIDHTNLLHILLLLADQVVHPL